MPEVSTPPTLPAVHRLPLWLGRIGQRMQRHLLLKTLGITAFMWLFFIGYFHLLRHPAGPVTLMPLTGLDRFIPFQPSALAIYVSLWFYVGIAPALVLSLRELVVYGLWAGALCISALACFYFWPTAVPAQAVDVLQHPAFAVLQGVDAAGNACPSLHVAAAMFSAARIDRLLRDVQAPPAMRWLNALWFVAIAYSTLATKQHVVLDVVGGALLGILFALASINRRSRG